MSSAENGRLVWLRDDESIERLGVIEFVRLVERRQRAAPADPAETIYRSVSPWIYGLGQKEGRGNCADAVLRALGVPDVPQRPTPRDETSHG